MADEGATPTSQDPWRAKRYPLGSQGYDRVLFFSDAVFAIALTLIVVQIGIPKIVDDSDNGAVWEAITSLSGNIFAFAFSFLWVAFYWKANHRFTSTLAAMSSRYITTVLVYLLLVAFLPFPTGLIGEYWNAVALAFFLLYVGCLSAMETVLGLVARHDRLYAEPLTSEQFRRWIYSSLSPVAGALIAAPLAFLNMYASLAAIFVVSFGLSAIVRRRYPVKP